jgi:Dolichyl-phosphate-mannose-protein mannosyltransferase
MLALLLIQLVLSRYWLDLIDEGYFADLADRIARGELPYRDFATPYTPGIHYLHAWAFALFGRDLVTLRVVLSVAKTALAVLLYSLARRLVPTPFALVPLALLFAIDTLPLMWEPHPAWYALLFATLTVWSITRRLERPADRWLILAGAGTGVACAFKQNLGLFALIAAVGFLIFADGLPPGRARLQLPFARHPWSLRLLRATFGAMAIGALTWLLRPYLEPRLAFVFLAPLFALFVIGLVDTARHPAPAGTVELVAGRLLWLAGGFLLGLLPWAIPLVLVVGWHNLPLAQFVGSLDLSGFYWALTEPRPGVVLFLVAAASTPFAVGRLCRPTHLSIRVVEASLFVLASAFATDLALASTADSTPDLSAEDATFWNLVVLAADSILLYLPSLAFWGALAGLFTASPILDRTRKLTLYWYLLAGSLLLFNFYPRLDSMHVTFSAPLLFIAGAFGLHRFYMWCERRLPSVSDRHLFKALLFITVLVLPVAAALPNLDWRFKSLFSVDRQGRPQFDLPSFVPLDVPGASILTPVSSRDAIGGVAHYLRQQTAPGEAIFVYPTLPMFYYLADRPNPTRFGHVYPAAATLDEQLEMIAALEARQVRFVVWDQYWVDEWGRDGKYLLNKPLTDYLLTTFRTERMIGPFYILVRSE